MGHKDARGKNPGGQGLKPVMICAFGKGWRIALSVLAGASCVTFASLPLRAHALDLGRLFYTPQERAEMDRKRFASPPPHIEKPVAAAPAPVEHQTAPSFVTLNGYVSRSSGHSTTWVNGEPRNDRLQLDANGVRIDEGSRRSVELRVGDTIERNSGQRRNLLENGNVGVGR